MQTNDQVLALWLLMYTGLLAHARTFLRKLKNVVVSSSRQVGRRIHLAHGLPRHYISNGPNPLPRREAPNMADQTRILALHAHPDDIEFQCAGTLALCRDASCAITIATM